jgi:Co/Zn/Cd efflux system component
MHNFIPYASRSSGTIKPSNRTLLQVAASTFLIFVIAEVFGALRSHSLSLLGDAIAMSVDVFTYFTNLYAEGTKENQSSRNVFYRMVNEIGIPSFSVFCLLGVTIYITVVALRVLRHPPAEDDLPVVYLYGFALLNLVIDVICGAFFCLRGKDVFYEPIVLLPLISLEVSLDSEEEEREFGHLEEDLDFSVRGSVETSQNGQDLSANCNGEGPMRKNLNMLSAFTHVGGDTIRTLSVIVAASTHSIFGIDADICDAWAAVAVAGTIVLITFPLILDIFGAWRSITTDNIGGGIYTPIPRFPRERETETDSAIGLGVFF